MSLALAAKHLAARGRGNDSMLVHMSPKEVSALQGVALAHGGSLSVNPDTGLPEASFLESVLPTVLGAGLMMIPGLNIGALGAAGIVGGAQYARTGDIGKGLMAGLGAYGGAGIGEGLASAGAAEAAKSAVPATPLPGLGGGAVPTPPAALPASVADASKFVTAPPGLPGLGGGPVPTPPAALPASVADTSQFIKTLPSTVSPAAQMSAGLGNVTSSADAFGSFVGANKYPLMAAATSIASKEGAFDAPKPPKEEEYIRPYKYSSGYTGGAGDYPSDYTGERRYFNHTFTPMPIQRLASGGLAGMHLEKGGFVVPADVVSALGNGSSSAGLEILADRIGARPIKGPGDGMSDSIRTSIEGKQKAAVAREEAYVPREKVKQVGGAKRLYDMMDKVRSKAHGKKSQQRKLSNPSKLVP